MTPPCARPVPGTRATIAMATSIARDRKADRGQGGKAGTRRSYCPAQPRESREGVRLPPNPGRRTIAPPKRTEQPGTAPMCPSSRDAKEQTAMHTTLKFLTSDDERLLMERAETRRFQRDDRILEEGSHRAALFLIGSGAVRVER